MDDGEANDQDHGTRAVEVRNSQPELPSWLKRGAWYIGFVVVTFLIGTWVVTELRTFWPTLIVSLFLGLSITPIVNRLEARGWRRGLGTGAALGGLLVGAAVFFTAFGSLLFSQLAELVKSIPGLVEDLIDWINEQFGTALSSQDVLDQIGISNADVAIAAAEIGAGALAFAVGAVTLIFNSFMVLFFAFYFAAQGPQLRRTIASWLPPRRQQAFTAIWQISIEMAGGYVISRGILAAISATAHGVLFLVLDLPYWLPIAMWVGIVSQFVPTIGTYLAGALPIVIALVLGEPQDAVLILIFVIIYQQVENLFLTPRITQSTLEVNAAVAFGAVIVGGTLYGAIGALLSIPVVAIILSVLDAYGRRYELVPELAEEHAAELERARVRAAKGRASAG